MPDGDVIMFGRGGNCTFIFPADLAGVAPLHLILIRTKSNDWVVGPLNGRFVAVNGRRIDDGATLHLDCNVGLAQIGGPGFYFRRWIALGGGPGEGGDRAPVNKALTIEELGSGRSATLAHSTPLPRTAPAEPPPDRVHEKPTTLDSILKRLARAALQLPKRKKDTPVANEETRDSRVPDVVDVSAFAPDGARPGDTVLIQIFLHKVGETVQATALAKEADAEAARRGVATLTSQVQRGQRVDVLLEATGLSVDEPFQCLVWWGFPRSCNFIASIPARTAAQAVHVRVRLRLDNVPVGMLAFALKIAGSAEPHTQSELRGDAARRYQYAFLSYASADRSEVLKRAQALKAARIDFFHDLLSLEPGRRWLPRLYEEIDRCDVFVLFWSSNAAKSEWVRRESERALDRRRKSAEELPDIAPIILEFPVPPPPDEMKDIQFSDSLWYIITAVQLEQELLRRS